MPSGVRDMGSNTATNLSPLNGMPSFPLPKNPQLGCTLYDDHRKIWVVWNGDEWVDVILNKHKCKDDIFKDSTINLDNEEPIQKQNSLP